MIKTVFIRKNILLSENKYEIEIGTVYFPFTFDNIKVIMKVNYDTAKNLVELDYENRLTKNIFFNVCMINNCQLFAFEY